MKINIYKVNVLKDKNEAAYHNINIARERGGAVPDIYKHAFRGEIDCSGDADSVFMFCNKDKDIMKRMNGVINISDVIEICDGENAGFYYVDPFDFVKIDFDTSKIKPLPEEKEETEIEEFYMGIY